MHEYWSVFDKDGNKIADCGWERDAVLLAKRRGGTYRKIKLMAPQTIDVPHIVLAPDLQLPMQQILPESDLKPFDP